jgi:hypothetical protein
MGTARRPQSWRPSAKMAPTKSQGPSAKAIPTLLGSTPRHPSNQSSFRKEQIAGWDHPPTSSNRPQSEHVESFSQDNNPISVSISLIIVCKAPFTNSSHVFLTQEWYNLARDDVLRLRKTPPLVRLLGWLVGTHRGRGAIQPVPSVWRS